jgi:ubiquinone/menaquinone biosynthesis C-methylase UbiE
LVGFDDLYRLGGAVTWQAGKEDVVRQVVDLLMGLDASSRVLDFGCGTGWTAETLVQHGGRYLGVDPSAEGIAIAERRYAGNSRVRFHSMAIDEALPASLQGAVFTHIFALDALYFVPDLEATLRSLLVTLEPGGLLTTISHLYRESRVAHSLVDDVTREHGLPQFMSGVQWQVVLERCGWNKVQRFRFYDRRPFSPAALIGHPPGAVALARELYEREGALVITARRPV